MTIGISYNYIKKLYVIFYYKYFMNTILSSYYISLETLTINSYHSVYKQVFEPLLVPVCNTGTSLSFKSTLPVQETVDHSGNTNV